MRAHAWASTPLGPPEGWPQSLCISLSTCLNSRFAILIWWGPELVMLYNDAYQEIIGSKHPAALGRPGRECFPEVWDIIGPMLNNVLSLGEATRSVDLPLYLERHGYPEECYFTFSYSPIREHSGDVGGVFTPVEETTDKVIGARRLNTLQQLASRSRTARDVKSVCECATQTLNGNLADVPFSATYLYSRDGRTAELFGRSGKQPGGMELPELISLPQGASSAGMEPESFFAQRPSATVALPLLKGQQSPTGFLVAGVSPHQQLDDAYRTFFEVVAGQIGAAVVEARAYEEERKRAEALAELDRAKTQFFSNISHEFRTPLTLMLAPLEDVLRTGLPDSLRQELSLIHRNGARLLKLVNTLLDFSSIEEGRLRASYEPTDLALLTSDVASSFRSAMEKGGLRYTVDCPPLGEPVFVDREMWEKVVLNLLSNAFKFTLSGEVAVSLRRAGSCAELTVKDTGPGIPEQEVPRLFERFHRVDSAQGRTHEGSGIGLALVRDLVRLHGGQVRVESAPGQGSTFTVSIPFGSDHLDANSIRIPTEHPRNQAIQSSYLEEARRCLPEAPPDADADRLEKPHTPPLARILIVEDNADMRDYLRRTLMSRYEVIAAPDGEAALQELRANSYDLVLSDVMMPRLDGFELVQRIRKDPEIGTMPVILLSARAGEDSGVQGLRAGADAYMVKPFSARDLLARVESQLAVAHLRRGLARKERQLREEAELERRRWLRLLMNAPAGIAVLRGPELVFEVVNDEFVRAGGRAGAADLLGKRFRDAFPELVSQGYIEMLTQVYQSGQPAFGKKRRVMLSRAGGSLEERFFTSAYQPSLGSNGEVDGVFIHSVDVTEEVLAERRLEESQGQFRNLANSIPNLAWIADNTGARLWFNKQWYEYTGLREEETKGWGWLRVYDPVRADGIIEKYKKQIQKGELWEETVRLRGRTGEYRWFLSRAIPVRDSEGKPVTWFGTSTDVTFEIEAQQRIGEAQRLESIALLAGGIAHDFNNLLVPVLGYASLAKDIVEPDSPVQPFFSEIESACDRAAKLTRQLLAYAGKTRFVLTQVNVEAAAREAITLASASIWKDIDIRVQAGSAVPSVEADPGEVQQIVVNLLLNAAEAIGENRGRIDIRVGVAEVADLPGSGVVVGKVGPGSHVLLEIQDTGCGMDEATQKKIFEPFFTTKFFGRGLGLAAVGGIIRAHGWGLTVESAPGAGSTFRVFLRAAAAKKAAPKPAAEVSTAVPAAGSRSILVVDDEDVVRRTAKLALERYDYRVVVAGSGSEAIKLFRSARGAFDLVLLDLTMPGMSGHETLAALREIDPQVKALVSSGYSEQQALHMFSGQPTAGFIQKPYTPLQLAERIKKVLS